MGCATTLEWVVNNKYPVMNHSQALTEAERCLYCFDPPCVKACPTHIDIPAFIKSIATKDTMTAANTIMAANVLGYSCAKACPVEVLCQGSCVYTKQDEPAIAIGRLQRFAMEHAMKAGPVENVIGAPKTATGKRVAAVGAGPASIAMAVMLAKEGIAVDVFDKRPFSGGLNAAGIAPYKLKHDEALGEIAWLTMPQVKFYPGMEISDYDSPTTRAAASLEQDYDAIFLGFGLGEGRRLFASCNTMHNVWDAYSLIEAIKTSNKVDLTNVRRAHVIGGGNSAIDAAHIVRKLGVPYVAMWYRGLEKDASGYSHEFELAKMAGVYVFERHEVGEIIHEDDRVVGLIEKKSGVREACDLLIFALGQKPMGELAQLFSNVTVNSQGLVIVDEKTYRTHNHKIWSAGDCVNGGKEVVNAVAEAKIAVKDMLSVLG